MSSVRPRIRLNNVESIKETFWNLHSFVIESKQNGEISQVAYNKLKEQYLNPFMDLVNKAGAAQSSYNMQIEKKQKYAILKDIAFLGGVEIEKHRATYALLAGDLAKRYPNDMNLRALHTNLMAEDTKTHKPIYKMSELSELIKYASFGIGQLCEEYQNDCQKQIEIEKNK